MSIDEVIPSQLPFNIKSQIITSQFASSLMTGKPDLPFLILVSKESNTLWVTSLSVIQDAIRKL